MKAPDHFGRNRTAVDEHQRSSADRTMHRRPGTFFCASEPTNALAATRSAPERRGSSLVMALVLVSGAALVSVLTLQRGIAQWKNQAASSAQKQAFYFAEAGLGEALDDLRAGGSGNVGTRDTPALFGDGAFWVESLTDAEGCVHITSTGLSGVTAYRLTQSIEKPPLPLGAHGFFGQADVVLGDGVTVSSLEAEDDGGVVEDVVEDVLGAGGGLLRIALPAPVVGVGEPQALVGSNGSIELGLATLVDGPVLPGPGSVVTSLLGALIGGSTVPETEMRDLFEIAMPVSDSTATIALAPRGSMILESGTHEYESITLANRGTLTIEGPASLYVEDLRIPTLGTLNLDTTEGPVHIYVADFLWAAPAARVTNTSGVASDAVILVDGRGLRDRDGDDPEDLEGAVLWESAHPMVGALYAPYAEVELPANTDWTGSITALGLTVGDDATLTFDPSVLDVELRGKRFRSLSWRIVEIPPADRRLIAKDLVRTAVDAGRTLKPAAAARIEGTTEFRFSTPDGKEFRYKGASLADVTRAAVDTVLPVVAKVADVPEFTKYEDDGEEVDDAVVVRFKRAYGTMLDNMGESGADTATQWAAALETGRIPPAIAQSINVDGVLVEPFRSALASKSLRDTMTANVAGCWLPPDSKRLLASAIALLP